MQIKKIRSNAIIPTKGSKYAAGYDLYACTDYDIEIAPHRMVKIGTGIAISLPALTFGGIFARSGLSTKQGLRPANCTGVIDEDYTGEILVPLYNDSNEPQYIHGGDRIAQLIIIPYLPVVFEEVSELLSTERGAGGFGHSGV